MNIRASILALLLCIGGAEIGRAQTVLFNRLQDLDQAINLSGTVLETDSGYLVLGQSITTAYRGFVLMQLNTWGDTLWTKQYNQSLDTNLPQVYFTGLGKSLIPTSDGGFAFCGGALDDADSSNNDGLLVKLKANGDTLWTRRYGGAGQDNFNQCMQTSDDGFIVGGWTDSYGNGLTDIYLVRVDSLGDTLWTRTYGGTGFDLGFSLDISNDSGYIISGYTDNFGEGIYVIKTDSLGNQLWQKTITVNDPGLGGSVFQSKDTGYIIFTAKDNLTGNGKDGYLAKLDSTGTTLLWEQTYGGANGDWFESAIELEDGSIVATGTNMSNAFNEEHGWLIKTDSDGNLLWERTFFITEDSYRNQFWSIAATRDNGFIMVGDAFDTITFSDDYWIVKTNCLGYDKLPQAGFGYTLTDSTTVKFTDASLQTGTWLWYFGDGDSLYVNWQQPQDSIVHVYPDTGTYIVTLITEACGDRDTLIDTILVATPVGINEASPRDWQLSVYPNPFTSITTLHYTLPGNLSEANIVVYDVLGAVVLDTPLNGNNGTVQIDLQGNKSGIYFVNLLNNNEVLITKKAVLVE